jgi:hypothetical protein
MSCCSHPSEFTVARRQEIPARDNDSTFPSLCSRVYTTRATRMDEHVLRQFKLAPIK